VISTDTMRRALWSVLAERTRVIGVNRYRPLWAFANRTFGIGAKRAKELCRDLGFDPDTGAVIRERGWEEPTC